MEFSARDVIVPNPELRAREKANIEYQNYKNNVDNLVANGKLPERIAQQWMEENPYKFEPLKDKNGKVIGGKEWRPSWTPIAPVDMTEVYDQVRKLVAEEAGGGENVRFVDENGNPVANPSSGMYSMQIKTGSSWKRLPAAKLKAAFKAALDQIPGAKETFEQDYRNKLWQFNKASDDEKQSFYGSDIMDSQGIKRTLEEYIAYKSDPIFERMAYNNVQTSIDYKENSTYLSGKMQAAADRAAAMAVIDAGEQPGPGMEIPLNNMLSETSMSISNTIKGLLDLYGKTDLYKKNGNLITGYINRGDYTGLADFLDNRQRFIINRDDKMKLQNYIRTLRAEGDSYSNLVSGIGKDDLDVLNENWC